MENKKAQRTTHNIKQLGFSGLRWFSARFSILVGGQERTPKTQPFHIVKRYRQANKITDAEINANNLSTICGDKM